MSVLVEVVHPLVQHHLARLRDEQTSPWEFRQAVQRLAQLVAYEATQDLATKDQPIRTPLAPANARVLAQRIGLVPILRAGLGMVDTIHNLIPTAEVWHLGLYRDETTALPVEYYCKLPKTEPVDVAMVLDPMLATGGSIIASLEALDRWGVKSLKVLSLIASRPGIAAVHEAFPRASIYVCAIDAELNARKFIVPGLGDAGDRTFNTLRHEG